MKMLNSWRIRVLSFDILLFRHTDALHLLRSPNA
jgi:hypothetical protein